MRPSPRLAALVLAALAVCSPRATAGDVEIRLTNGERLYGELLAETPQGVTVNRKLWTRGGQIGGKTELPRARIAAIEPVESLEDLYQKHAAETADTFDAQYSLARWCFERGLQDHAFAHGKRLYDKDPADEITRQLLQEIGYVLDDGTWLKEADYAQKHGLLVFEGRLMTPQQVELRKASLKADVDRDAALTKSRSLDGTAANAERRVKDAQERVDHLKQDLQKLKQQQAQARKGGGGNGRNRNNNQQQQQQPVSDEYADAIKQLDGRIADAQKGVEDARKNLDKCKQDAGEAKAAADQAAKKSEDAKQAFADATAKTPVGGAKPAAPETGTAKTPDAKPADAKPTDAKDGAVAKPAPVAPKPMP